MKYSRRELSGLLAAAAVPQGAARGATSLVSKTYQFGELPVHQSAQNLMRPILEGQTHTGLPIELHMTELAPGQAPHPAHHHVHEEMILIQEGLVAVTIAGHTTNIGPGSVAFVASGEEHGWRNIGTTRAQYFVLALGRDSGA